MNKEMIAYLKIKSWIGFGAGGHYYGTLCYSKDQVEIERTLNRSEATKLNRHDGSGWMIRGQYKEGSPTTRFNSETEIIEAACHLWREQFPDARILRLGDRFVLDPQRVLAGLSEAKTLTLNGLVDRADAIGRWDDGNDKEMTKISAEWNDLMKNALDALEK